MKKLNFDFVSEDKGNVEREQRWIDERKMENMRNKINELVKWASGYEEKEKEFFEKVSKKMIEAMRDKNAKR